MVKNCSYCKKTDVLWLPNANKCRVYHCYYKGDKIVAHGHARYATDNDSIDGNIINANYLCVRSCYCNPSCYAYTTDSIDR